MIDYILIFTSCFITCVYTNEFENITEYDDNSRFFQFPNGDGKMELVDKYDLSMRSGWFNPEDEVLYLLYTRDNVDTPYYLKKGDESNLFNSYYNNSKPLKMIVHGWKNDYQSPVNYQLVSAFLSKIDTNVIVVDWSSGASESYLSASLYVPRVGEEIANFIDWMISLNTNIKNIHLLGHSLGAHVVGNIGRNVKSGKIPYITAFDPAGPLWGIASARIRSDDAEYVEVIHTSAGYAGLLDVVGDVDIFPNGGKWMPGCGLDIACSHSRSYAYFAETIPSGREVGANCESYDAILDRTCNKIEIKSNDKFKMGGEFKKRGKGIFYMKTNDREPFFVKYHGNENQFNIAKISSNRDNFSNVKNVASQKTTQPTRKSHGHNKNKNKNPEKCKNCKTTPVNKEGLDKNMDQNLLSRRDNHANIENPALAKKTSGQDKKKKKSRKDHKNLADTRNLEKAGNLANTGRHIG